MKERQPPAYRFVIAVGPYRVGDIIRPVGIYRDALLERKVIEPADVPRKALAEGEEPPPERRPRLKLQRT